MTFNQKTLTYSVAKRTRAFPSIDKIMLKNPHVRYLTLEEEHKAQIRPQGGHEQDEQQHAHGREWHDHQALGEVAELQPGAAVRQELPRRWALQRQLLGAAQRAGLFKSRPSHRPPRIALTLVYHLE